MERSKVICLQCGSRWVEDHFDHPLCEACRTRSARRPIPAAIIVGLFLAGSVFAMRLPRTPQRLDDMRVVDRAGSAHFETRYADAAAAYQQLYDRYPESVWAFGHFAINSYLASPGAATSELVRQARHRNSDKALAEKLDQILARAAWAEKTGSPPQSDGGP